MTAILVGFAIEAFLYDVAEAAPSAGCTDTNDPLYDSMYRIGIVPTTTFFAGETIIVTAGPPETGTPIAPLFISLDLVVAASGSYPGTISYTFPADTNVELRWGHSEPTADATFSVICTTAITNTTTTLTCTNSDHRENALCDEPWQTAAVYCNYAGIDVYGMGENGKDVLVIRLASAEIMALKIPDENTLIRPSDDGLIRLYLLAGGTAFQVNAPAPTDNGWDVNGYKVIIESCTLPEDDSSDVP